jgi:hypothetical protein
VTDDPDPPEPLCHECPEYRDIYEKNSRTVDKAIGQTLLIHEASRAVKALVRRCEAQENFLAAFRVGGRPSEKAFTSMEATRDTVAEAKSLLAEMESDA